MNSSHPEHHFLSQMASLDESFRRGRINRGDYLKKLRQEYDALKRTGMASEIFLKLYDPAVLS